MLIGLTGGIASGKSIVAGMFKSLGAYIIDADQISRDVMLPESETYKKVVNTFGKEILKIDRSIDRRKLGDIVFGDQEKIARLNECTHPEIFKEINHEVENIRKEHPDALIIIDVPLLIETKVQNIFDKIIVVYTEEAAQLRRLNERDGLSKTEANKRITSQIPLEEKVKHADFVIYNDKGLENTRKQVEEIYKKLSAFRK